MKIVYIISSLEKCGPVNVLFNIVKYLDKQFNVTIITLSSEGPNTRVDEFEQLGVKVHPLKIGKSTLSLFRAKSAILSIIQDIGADIVHSHGLRSDLLSALISKQIHTVTTIHNYPFEDYILAYKKILGMIMAVLNYISFKIIQVPVACSNSINNKFKSTWKTTFNVIQNGIDLDVFNTLEKQSKEEVRKSLGISPDKKVFLYLGALINRKDPLFVINAFKDKMLKDYILLVVGSGELSDLCKTSVKDSENILMIGQVGNPEIYYNASDYYISSSQSEGLPMAVLEALASGLPSLLSDIEPHKEILIHESEAGELYTLNNLEDFKNKVYKLTSSDYLPKRAAANRLIREHLSADIMSGKYQKLYSDLAKKE
jgi:glycosyltransferase involved in cell wall biosynthesis